MWPWAVPAEDRQGGPGGPGGKPGRRSSEISHRPGIHPEKLSAVQDYVPDERAMRLQDHFNDYVASGEPIEFEGHSICWAMIALLQKLRKNQVLMYMPPFGKSLDLIPMRRVADPKDNPMMKFDITEQGDDVHIVVTLLNDGNPDPFQMSPGRCRDQRDRFRKKHLAGAGRRPLPVHV